MLALRGTMGAREVARSPLTEVIRSVPQTADQGPVFLIAVRPVAISAPQLDPSLAAYQPYRLPQLFDLETELIADYKSRLEAIENTMRLKEKVNSADSDSLRSSMQLELNFARSTESRQFETNRLAGRKALERQADEERKITALMSQVKLSSKQEARFYLEAQNWDVQAAAKFIKQAGVKTSPGFIIVDFRLPDGESLSHRFEKDDVMWGMLTVVYKHFSQQHVSRNFKLKYEGQVLSEEHMSAATFDTLGVGSSCNIEVVWA